MSDSQRAIISEVFEQLQEKSTYVNVPLLSIVSKEADRIGIFNLAEKCDNDPKQQKFYFMASNNVQRDQAFADKTKELLVDVFEEDERDAINRVFCRESVMCLSICFKTKSSETGIPQRGGLRSYRVISTVVFMPIQSKGCFVFYLATTALNYGKSFGGGHDKKPFRKRGFGRFLLKLAQLMGSNIPQIKNQTLFLTVPVAENQLLKQFYHDVGFHKGWGDAQESVDTLVQDTLIGYVQKLHCTRLILQLPLLALDMDFGCGLSMTGRKKQLEELQIDRISMALIDQCVTSVFALPDVLKREVFGGVVASSTVSGGVTKVFAVGSFCGMVYRELVRYKSHNSNQARVLLAGRKLAEDCFLNLFCEIMNSVHVLYENGRFSMCCGQCMTSCLPDTTKSSTEDIMELLYSVPLWISHIEEFYRTHFLGMKQVSIGANEPDVQVCSEFWFAPTFSKKYEYLYSLVQRDKRNLADAIKGGEVIDLTFALWRYCIDKIGPKVVAFLKGDCATWNDMNIGYIDVPETLCWIQLFRDGDKYWKVPCGNKAPLAKQVHTWNVFNGMQVKTDIKLIHENDWVAVDQRFPFVPMEETCSCDDDAWCNDTYCKFVAMNVECSAICKGGVKCGNQRIQRGNNFEFVQLFDAGDKGIGLKATKCFHPREFIIEYVGSVLDSSGGDVGTYKLSLKEKGLVVDATKKGNFARFINHSCDPNCNVEVWEVRKLAIENVALLFAPSIDIDPLSYDLYLFSIGEISKGEWKT